MYFRIKNWETHQHYKRRDPPWVKLHRSMLQSNTWVSLDDASKALAIACIMLAAGCGNKVKADPNYIKRVAYLDTVPDLNRLAEVDFIEFIDENENPLAHASTMLAHASTMLANACPEQSRAEQSRDRDRDRAETETEQRQIQSRDRAEQNSRADDPSPSDPFPHNPNPLVRQPLKPLTPADGLEYWGALAKKVEIIDPELEEGWKARTGPKHWREAPWPLTPEDAALVAQRKREGRPLKIVPVVGGAVLDEAADLVCDAAKINQANWRGDWRPLTEWLQSGIDLYGHILPTVTRIASRQNYMPPSNLKYFDAAVREAFAQTQNRVNRSQP